MKVRLFTLVIVLAMAFAAFSPAPALAQNPAYNTSFTTSITYQNTDTLDATNIQILFYANPTSTTPVTISCTAAGTPCLLLKKNAGSSIYIGSLGDLDANFQGSAVMYSDVQMVATLVQVPTSTTVKNRPLSNGFKSGAPTALIATILKNTFKTTTVFSVQNTDSQANNVTVQFYNTSAVKVHEFTEAVESGASTHVDAGTLAALGASFNGSAVITAKRADNTDGSIVATAMELGLSGNDTYANAFESVAAGATKFYMPSALCNYNGVSNTSYAVQNTSLTAQTKVRVTYSNGIYDEKDILPGAKQSFAACAATGGGTMTQGFLGSAIVTSDTTPVIAVGKVGGGGLSTAFLGSAGGAPTLALPYVRWSQTQYTTGQRQRAFIAVQNVGAAAINSGELKVEYYDKDGLLVTTHTYTPASGDLAVGAKWNSNPYATAEPNAAEFGYVGGFGGSAKVVCTAANCQVSAVVRVQSMVGTATVGEDYNGINLP